MNEHDRAAPVPAAYRGVWRRTLLEGGGLLTDTSSMVLWLQTARWHADLRLPPGRPAFAGVHDVTGCSPAQRIWLARQQGFSGVTEVLADQCQWHHDLDFHGDTKHRDIGTMIFHADGSTVEEYGVDAAYHETWQRLPESIGPSAVWCSGASPQSRLLVAGDCFFLVRPSIRPSTMSTHRAAKALAMPDYPELSYGRISGAARPWRIDHSTLPWREGRSLDEETWHCLDAEAGAAAPPRVATSFCR